MKRKYNILLIILTLLALSSILVLDRLAAYSNDAYREAEIISEVRDKIFSYYVEEVASTKLLDGALHGMVSVLDPHSEYLDAEDYRQIFEGTEGEFIGIGIEITLENGVLTVISPIEGAPAAAAGVLAGDKIIAIEDVSTEGITLLEAVNRLRGKRGTTVTITVIHEGSHVTENITITRDRIHIQSIKDQKILDRKDGIGYLRLAKFNKHTKEELRNSIDQLLQQNIKSLIIDLRFNPGGLLEAAIAVVNCFIQEGVIVYTKGRSPDSHQVYRATSEDTYENLALAVLVNKGSASASEIVAGALQDYHRALIVGSNTYGKGSVQSIIQLRDEKTAIKLTTAKYYTPCGKSIHRENDADGGVTPDVLVTLSSEEEKKLLQKLYKLSMENSDSIIDQQLMKAIAVLKKEPVVRKFR